MTPTVQHIIDSLPEDARVLDAGGWFSPLSHASHVADFMPYETRWGRLQPGPLSGERFTKETWHLCDFTRPGLRLPYEDGYFDLVYCGQTLEDLSDPEPLLREMARVGRSGLIVSPSRMSEQTRGVRDRMTSAPGHPHHKWILDADPGELVFSSKEISLSDPLHIIPLRNYEASPTPEMIFQWKNNFRWRYTSSTEARQRARDCGAALGIRCMDRLLDGGVRRLRRLKNLLCHRGTPDRPADWWKEMQKISRPFLPSGASQNIPSS